MQLPLRSAPTRPPRWREICMQRGAMRQASQTRCSEPSVAIVHRLSSSIRSVQRSAVAVTESTDHSWSLRPMQFKLECAAAPIALHRCLRWKACDPVLRQPTLKHERESKRKRKREITAGNTRALRLYRWMTWSNDSNAKDRPGRQ